MKSPSRHGAILIIPLAILLFTLPPIPALADANWPVFRQGPEGRASLEYQGSLPLLEWYYQYKTTQRFEPGVAVWASPALALVNGRPTAFIGGHNQALLALDVSGRRVLWLKITNGVINETPVVGVCDNRLTVFFGSADRSVYALDAATGETVWTRELIPPAPTLGAARITSPLLHAQKVYIAIFAYDKSLPRNRQQTWLFCLDAKSGAVCWKYEIGRGYVSSPVGFLLEGKYYLVVASRKGLVQCFSLTSGRPRRVWTYLMPHEVFASPVVEQNCPDPYLFLGSKFGNFAALDARSGEKKWQRMAGHWIDNGACLGEVDGRRIVFVGSHDYHLYAYAARSGELLWRRPLGGEIYSAPAFFHVKGEPMVAVACLDDRVYAVRAKTGMVAAAFFAGEPLWDKAPKGETLLASPAVFSAGNESALVHGSYGGSVCVFPLLRKSMFRDTARSFRSLWWSLPLVLVVFLGVILPVVILLPDKRG
ncbi:PQQ-binding-like beta-propeller repeat protein [candidate division FCPU426 bacterium]|nr:PQQ-binding-like beta-propeller repeat protein [candidate division FCPU426 bacterium]